jgi:hypothetical protein
MIKWQYLVYFVGTHNEPEELQHKLNKMGSQGWELVSIDWSGAVAIFKKRIGYQNEYHFDRS